VIERHRETGVLFRGFDWTQARTLQQGRGPWVVEGSVAGRSGRTSHYPSIRRFDTLPSIYTTDGPHESRHHRTGIPHHRVRTRIHRGRWPVFRNSDRSENHTMNSRVLPPFPDEPPLPADEVSPCYLRILRMLNECTAKELNRLKLKDIPAIQRDKLEIAITHKEQS